MNIMQVAKLGASHILNDIAENIFIHTKKDYTRPKTIYALINEKCNSKCLYCDFWSRTENDRTSEMDIEAWKEQLTNLKQFSKKFSINFSGGEPLLKPGFLELMKWCSHNNIQSGFTTNGLLMRGKALEQIVDANPFNINISLDSHSAEVHDYVRGKNGCFDIVTRNVAELRKLRDAKGHSFPIVVKPTVHKHNYKHLSEIASMAESIGATAVNFQPIVAFTDTIKELFWIEEECLVELQASIERLIVDQSLHIRIINSHSSLRMMTDHFQGKKANKKYLPCRIGLRSLFIKPDGGSMLCWDFEECGNIFTEGIQNMWRSDKTKSIRSKTLKCKKLCLLTCTSQKSILDRAKVAISFLRS